jgi:hypothetical protein
MGTHAATKIEARPFHTSFTVHDPDGRELTVSSNHVEGTV